LNDHYWKSVWNDEGQFICKVCGLPPKECTGKVRIGKESEK